jgi:hypothetical protein
MGSQTPAEAYAKLASQMEGLAQQAATPEEQAGYLRLASVWKQLDKARLTDNGRTNQRFAPRRLRQITGETMASNEPTGDNRRIGAVKKRTQLKTKMMGEAHWTKRDKNTGKFMDVKKSQKKFKGVRKEKKKAA